MYLAALELDPDPQPPEALKFKELIGRTLIIGNARDVETTPPGAVLLTKGAEGERRRFDLIVGIRRGRLRAKGAPPKDKSVVVRATRYSREVKV